MRRCLPSARFLFPANLWMSYTEPLLLLFLSLCVVSLVLLGCVKPNRGRSLLSIGILGLILTSWQPAAWLFSRPLEIRFPNQPITRRDAQAIVVPGSDYLDPD